MCITKLELPNDRIFFSSKRGIQSICRWNPQKLINPMQFRIMAVLLYLHWLFPYFSLLLIHWFYQLFLFYPWFQSLAPSGLFFLISTDIFLVFTFPRFQSNFCIKTLMHSSWCTSVFLVQIVFNFLLMPVLIFN